MTNSMIPYSFTPGTKAKAQEVNANFNALADKIDENDSTALHYNTSATISGDMTFTKPIVSTANGLVTTGNIVTELSVNEATDVAIALEEGTTTRIVSLRFEKNTTEGNRVLLTCANDADKEAAIGVISLSCKDGQYIATCPTYTANYADSSTKIVTTAFLTNRWTTSKATTTSSASKARPAVVIQNYVSGKNWYRIWSDGWIEQGGLINLSGDPNSTITFLKAFSNTNYTIVSAADGYNSTANLGITAKYTNKVTMDNSYQSDYNWYVCGY